MSFMKFMLVALLLISQNVLADTCSDLKTESKYFNASYIKEFIGAPNWDDLCNELLSDEEVDECNREAVMWEIWFKCDKKLKYKFK